MMSNAGWKDDLDFIIPYNDYHTDEDDDMYMQNVDEDIDLEYPSSEELLSGYSSDDEPRPRFLEFCADKDTQDPKFVVGQ
ncbi:Hypothetical predicted protein, partial [Olea europaea subsp. europaea]